MPKYKLIYFNGRGRAELARLIFAQAGKEYEDSRIEREAWAAMKPDTPFGQLPILEVDGVQIAQSGAIARYLAKSFGLAGKNDMQQAQADMIVDSVEDMLKPLAATFTAQDEGQKAELKRKFQDEQLPDSLNKLEKLLKGDYFVGDEITWADLSVAQALTWPPLLGITVDLEKTPKLKALRDRVESSPKIAAWLEKRPQTPF